MTEKEQIEELTRFQCADCGEGCKDCPYNVTLCPAKERATKIYHSGFRKQSEGEWVDQYQGMYVNQLYKCSLCGETAFHDDKRWFLTHHCPNCGAKMKGCAE